MLQTHTIDPEDPASGAGQALYTITAGGCAPRDAA